MKHIVCTAVKISHNTDKNAARYLIMGTLSVENAPNAK
jgi:hypothetical protein